MGFLHKEPQNINNSTDCSPAHDTVQDMGESLMWFPIGCVLGGTRKDNRMGQKDRKSVV